MGLLKIKDETKFNTLVSFTKLDTQQAEQELVARGWTNAEALVHIDMAIRIGAVEKVETKAAGGGTVKSENKQ